MKEIEFWLWLETIQIETWMLSRTKQIFIFDTKNHLLLTNNPTKERSLIQIPADPVSVWGVRIGSIDRDKEDWWKPIAHASLFGPGHDRLIRNRLLLACKLIS